VSDAFAWWWLIQLIGLIGFPVTFQVFRFLPDRGYNFAKIVGLLGLSFLAWIGASLHVIPNDRWSLVLILGLLAVISLAIATLTRAQLREFLARRWLYVLGSEALFTLAFAVALLLRTDVVDLLPGERPTDAGLMNAIIRADYFPPKDPWLSGHDVNYYYFGHLMVTELAMLGDVPVRIAFNLGLGLIAALSVSAAFGLTYNLLATRASSAVSFTFALAAPFLLLIVSNLEGLFELLAVHDIGSSGFYHLVDIHGLDGPRESSEWYPTEWYWTLRATNFVNGSVDRQFPFAKFMYGELHSENLAIPLVLLVMGFALNFWYSTSGFLRLKSGVLLPAVFTALAMGGLAVAQPWYVPALLALLAVVLAGRCYLESRTLSLRTLRPAVLLTLLVAVLAVLIYFPFYYSADFGSIKGFILETGSGATQPHHFFYMWLPLGWLAGVLVSAVAARAGPVRRTITAAALPALAVLALWATMLLFDAGPGALVDDIIDRAANASWLTVLILGAFLTASVFVFFQHLARAEGRGPGSGTAFALVLVALATLLLLGVEFFWVDDGSLEAMGAAIYGSIGFNTYIKANFLAWFFLSIGGAYGLYRLLAVASPRTLALRAARWSALTIAAVVIGLGLIYPVTSTLYTTRLFNEPRHLDMLWGMRAGTPAEYEAILWLGDNVSGTPTVLEAVGDSYTPFARVSANTGLPTVLGWPAHEAHWRGGSWEPQAGRREAVERIYETTDPAEAKALLDQYDVEYVYVGPLEREAYGEAGLNKFPTFMDVAYENADVSIYRMSEPAEARER
jgi:YYY domain-containing protein